MHAERVGEIRHQGPDREAEDPFARKSQGFRIGEKPEQHGTMSNQLYCS